MKTAIITGASRGIGYAIARLYAKKGWNLIINSGHNEQALFDTARELSSLTQIEACFGNAGDEAKIVLGKLICSLIMPVSLTLVCYQK